MEIYDEVDRKGLPADGALGTQSGGSGDQATAGGSSEYSGRAVTADRWGGVSSRIIAGLGGSRREADAQGGGREAGGTAEGEDDDFEEDLAADFLLPSGLGRRGSDSPMRDCDLGNLLSQTSDSECGIPLMS